MLAPSRDVRHGAVLTLRLMGEDVVVYRTQSGRLNVVRPYCPHLGTHLGCGGWVDGENIVCPFHRFAFDSDGAVARVGPGYTGQPVRDKLVVLPAEEVNGGIYVWVGADADEAPRWRIPPVLEARGMKFARIQVGTHPQEISENGVDLRHQQALHAFAEAECLGEPVLDRHRYSYTMHLTQATPFGRVLAEGAISFYGLGFYHLVFRVPQYRLRHDIAVGIRALAPWQSEMLVGTRVTVDAARPPLSRLPRVVTDALSEAASGLGLASAKRLLTQDVPIWHGKRYINPPRIAPGDGPIGGFRKWAEQFYPAQGSAGPEALETGGHRQGKAAVESLDD